MTSRESGWNNAIIYQPYVWSFKEDSKRPQRGNGSIKGIEEELDYIQHDAGADAIWISPPYPSPMNDCGYDVTDFTDIHPELGNLEDFGDLIENMHERGMKMMLDIIPNHTSTDHEWFQKSREGNGDYKDYYIWNDGRRDESGELILDSNGRPLPPNNWGSVFSKPMREARDRGEMPELRPHELTPYISAWEWDDARGAYYNRTFVREQADLNWKNPKVQRKIQDVSRFWLKFGVDGFRVDAINHSGKNYRFDDEAFNPRYSEWTHDNPYDRLERFQSCNYPSTLYPNIEMMNLPLHEALERGQDVHQILEAYAPEDQLRIMNKMDPSVASTFNFNAMRTKWDAASRKRVIDEYYRTLPKEAIANQVNGNHDNPRLATHLGDAAARAAGMMNLMMPGIRIIYGSEELGLHDGEVPRDRIKDPNGFRDGARTPILWDDMQPNAGFSGASYRNLWLPVNWQDARLSVVRQRQNYKSTLAMYGAASRLCKELQALAHGRYVSSDTDNPNVYAFVRATSDNHAFVMTNFSDEPQTVRVPDALNLTYTSVLSSVDVEQDRQTRVNLQDGTELQPNECIALIPKNGK